MDTNWNTELHVDEQFTMHDDDAVATGGFG